MHACAFTAVSWLGAALWEYLPFAAVVGISAAAVVIVLLKAPSEHPDNPLADVARVKSRRRCIIHSLLLAAAAMLAGALDCAHLSLMIALSALSAAGTMLFKNKPTESD
jgi:cobalamin synthase